MYKTIICAVEVGEEGSQVLAKAKKLAKRFDSKLIVVNVLPYAFLPKDYQKELKDKAIPAFDKFMAETGISKKNSLVKVGKPYEVICALAEKKGADLIVLGTHSHGCLSSIIGSTANGVINRATCDVSLVKI